MDFHELSLQEQLLLLALDDASGQFRAAYLNYAFNAAALIELSDRGAVAIDGEAVRVLSTQPTGVDVLDLALSHLASDPRDRELERLIRLLYRHPSTVEEILLARLVLKGILREDEGRFLWVFSHLTHPTANPAIENEMRKALKSILLGQASGSPAEARLAALVNACGLIEAVLTGDEIREHAADIEAARQADALGAAVASAVLAVVKEDRLATQVVLP